MGDKYGKINLSGQADSESRFRDKEYAERFDFKETPPGMKFPCREAGCVTISLSYKEHIKHMVEVHGLLKNRVIPLKSIEGG